MKYLIFSIALLSSLHSIAQNRAGDTIRGFIPRPEAIYLSVYSGGCTSKSDFRTTTENHDTYKSVRFYRMRADECFAFFPMGLTIPFSYQELGLKSGDHFRIENTISDGIVW